MSLNMINNIDTLAYSMSNKYVRKTDWTMSFLIMLFIFSPVLSTQADAHPGAPYVLIIVLPVFLIACSRRLMQNSNINLCAICLFIFAILSSAVSDLSNLDFGTFLKNIVFITFFFSTSSYVFAAKPLKIAFLSYLLLGIVLAVLIILSFIFGYPHIENSLSQGRYSIGITGIFKNPNYLTSFYNVAFFVICYIMATVKLSIKKTAILLLSLALFIVSSFFSGTRAALLVEILILSIVPIIMAKRKHLTKIIIVLLIVSFIIFSYLDEINFAISLFLGNRDAFSDEGRSDAWEIAFNYIQDNPVLGCGVKSWNTISHGSSHLEYLHNIFLELFLDQGLIGILFVTGMVCGGYKYTKKTDRTFILFFLIFSAIPMCFQNGLYEVNFWRFIIINRLMMNISIYNNGGINCFLKSTFGDNKNNIMYKN